MKPSIPAVILATILVGTSSAAYANFVVNGNFDNPDVHGAYNFFSNGQVQGWTNTKPLNNDGIEIDAGNIATLGGVAYPGTTQSVELNGLTTFDWLSQTISGLAVGAHYTLSWAYGDRPGYGAQRTDVYFGSTFVATNTSTGAESGLTWTFNSFDVIALDSSETLTFKAINVGGAADGGNEITAVSLVPEPASTAVFGLGLLGVAMSRRRKAAHHKG
ncbi:MAG: hypothetical protein JWR21_3672 [Herminiimonas sp.]|nr:hypothetical protein [Herminiimonas sp.]